MTAYIGYKNLFTNAASTTASNEASGFEKENCYDWKLFDFWKPGATGTQTLKANFSSAVTADYLGVYGHNLGGEGVTIKLQYSTAGSSGPWTTVITKTPLDKEVLFIKFDSTSAADWQIELKNCTVDAKIGVMSFGEITALPDGLRWPFTPAIYQPYQSDINLSQAMIPLGNTVKREPISFDLNQSFVSESEARQILKPIYKHFESIPGAFFAWNESQLINSFCDYNNDLSNWSQVGDISLNLNSDISPDGTMTADYAQDNDAAFASYLSFIQNNYSIDKSYYLCVYVLKDEVTRDISFPSIQAYSYGGTTNAFATLKLDKKTGEIDAVGNMLESSEVRDNGNYWLLILEYKDPFDNLNCRIELRPSHGSSINWDTSVASQGYATFAGAYVTDDKKTSEAMNAGKEKEALYIFPDQKQKMANYTHQNLMKSVLKLHGLRD